VSDKNGRETLKFQTEVRQLLQLMVHSLYSNKEIFLRELISNASDAADKLRFEALATPALLKDNPELQIEVAFNAEDKTLSVTDNGIGMSRDELIENIGTIAKSGTAEFLQQMTGDEQNDAKLIGQFGVGFYSAFSSSPTRLKWQLAEPASKRVTVSDGSLMGRANFPSSPRISINAAPPLPCI